MLLGGDFIPMYPIDHPNNHPFIKISLLVLFSLALLNPLLNKVFSTAIEERPQEIHYTYRIINAFPHDPKAFTQGLIYHHGFIYESTGLYGRSSLRRARLEDGSILQKVSLPDHLFGEGISIWEDRIIQLTWRENIALVYDLETLSLVGEFVYDTEGWGLTHNEEFLIMSDGSSTLTFRDPTSFEPIKTITVTSKKGPVHRLNELEHIEGSIYANIWFEDTIARIDPKTGYVTAWINLSGLLDSVDGYEDPVDVLNGIAYDPDKRQYLVTGKLWPKIFAIELIEESQGF